MKVLRAMLTDSWHEAVARRALHVLLLIALLAVAWTMGTSATLRDMGEVLKEEARKIPEFRRRTFVGSMSNGSSLRVVVEQAGPLQTGGGLTPEFEGGFGLTLFFPQGSGLKRRTAAWESWRKGDALSPPPVAEGEVGNVSPGRITSFLKERFEHEGWQRVAVELHAEGRGYRARLRLATQDLRELRGAYSISHFFGLMEDKSPNNSLTEQIVTEQVGLGNQVVGAFGILIALMTCAGFVPNMLKKGSVDLLLARPVSRTRLLLYKYLGGLWFVLIVATVMLGGCYLAFALRTGYTSPSFFFIVPVLVLSFAIIYSLVVLMGVLTGSGTVAGLVGVLVWMVAGLVNQTRYSLQLVGDQWDKLQGWVRTLLDVSYTILPKTNDLGHLVRMLIAKGQLSSEAYQRMSQGPLPHIDWVFSLSTTLAFMLITLGLACWRFSRRDC